MSRRVTAVALLTALGLVGALPGPASAHDASGGVHENGQLPAEALVAAEDGTLLRGDAAAAYDAMRRAAARDGAALAVTGGYRSFEKQVELRASKGSLAATPGTSMHGWGLAVDFDTDRTDFSWLNEKAAQYGWVLPEWARPGGSNPEPWHWEFVGNARAAHAPASGQPSDSLATLSFERPGVGPLVGPPLPVFDGTDPATLRRGPGRYPGTAAPGEDGNMVVAGHRTQHGAPFLHLDALRAGDLVHVVAEQRWTYQVRSTALVHETALWVAGPDPLARRTPTLTLTTNPRSRAPQRLVVFAELITPPREAS